MSVFSIVFESEVNGMPTIGGKIEIDSLPVVAWSIFFPDLVKIGCRRLSVGIGSDPKTAVSIG